MARGVRATVVFFGLFLLLATSAAEKSHERGLKDVLVIEDSDGISVLEVDDLELSTPALVPSRVAEQPQQQQQTAEQQQSTEQQPAGEQQIAAAYDDEDDDISMILHALEQAEREENAFEAGSTATATDDAALSADTEQQQQQQQQQGSATDADGAPQDTALLVLDTARAAGAEAVAAALGAASAARATAAAAEADFGTWASAALDAVSREAAQLFGAMEAQQGQLTMLLGRRAGPFDGASSSEGPSHMHMGGMRRPCPRHAAMMAAAAAAASHDAAAAQPSGFAFMLRGAPMLLGPFTIGPAAATPEDAPAPAVLLAEPEATPEAAPVEATSLPLGGNMVTIVLGFALGTVAALVAAAVRTRSLPPAALATPRAHYAALPSDDDWVARANKLQAPQHVLAWDPSLDGDADLKGPAVVLPRRAAALSEESGAAAVAHYHNKLFGDKGQQM